MDSLVVISLMLIIVFFVAVCVFLVKYIQFIIRRQLFIVENIEKIRDDFIEFESALYYLLKNPLIMHEADYKKLYLCSQSLKEVMAEFEEFYQNLPEKKDDK